MPLTKSVGSCLGILLSLLLVAPKVLAGTPDSEICRSPALGIIDNQTVSDTLNFTNELEIQDLEISLDISHTWVGDLTITVSSPAGTSVALHSGSGGNTDNMLLTYSDSGIANGAPFTCNCDMQTDGGLLSSAVGESSLGIWNLSVTDSATQDQGVVNQWCVGVIGIPIDQFIRGDADSNGAVSGLVDGSFLLAFQFIAGSPTPGCMDAADVDNNGVFNGLIDAAYLLNFFFVSGNPAPPAPYPACGSDDDAALGCATLPVACN